MNQKERVVREKRTIEATKKELMGPSGKLGFIARVLGSPIMRHGGGLYDVSYLDDPYEIQPEIEYEKTVSGQNGPIAWRDAIDSSGDDMVGIEGYVFDGLSRGLHLEITCYIESHKISVTYKGFLVYREMVSELEAYTPFPEWETHIENLYKSAKKRKKEADKQNEAEVLKEATEMKLSFWQKMRMRWGI